MPSANQSTPPTSPDDTWHTPDLNARWQDLLNRLQALYGFQKFSLEGLMLLIGLREMGLGPEQLEKEDKQNLINVGVCTVLSTGGYYRFHERDAGGWPHFELLKALPAMDVFDQVHFMRHHVLQYFDGVFGGPLQPPTAGGEEPELFATLRAQLGPEDQVGK